MPLADVVNLQISRTAAAVSRQGFGVMMILGPNATGWNTDRVRSYSTADAMLTDGFESSDPEYIAAQRAFSQKVRPQRVLVGLRLTPVAQVVTIDLQGAAANAAHYIVTINGTAFDFTSDADGAEGEIHTGLLALVNGGSEPVTASGGTTNLVLTADNAGVPFTVTVSENLSKVTTTANVGVLEDLVAIKAVRDDWYALVLTSRDEDEVLVAANWIETQRKIFIACSDAANLLTSATDDIASQMGDLSLARTAVFYSSHEEQMPEAAWLGRMLPLQPGSATYKFKTLAGVTVDTLSDTEYTNAKAKNVNVYTEVGGVGMTEEGVVASGEFLDVIVGIDWIHSNMQADVFQVLLNNEKVPYTDNGIVAVESAIKNRLRLAVDANILTGDPEPTVTVPLAADVSPEDKAARRLTGVSFSGTLAGAVHATTITGNVAV